MFHLKRIMWRHFNVQVNNFRKETKEILSCMDAGWY